MPCSSWTCLLITDRKCFSTYKTGLYDALSPGCLQTHFWAAPSMSSSSHAIGKKRICFPFEFVHFISLQGFFTILIRSSFFTSIILGGHFSKIKFQGRFFSYSRNHKLTSFFHNSGWSGRLNTTFKLAFEQLL